MNRGVFFFSLPAEAHARAHRARVPPLHAGPLPLAPPAVRGATLRRSLQKKISTRPHGEAIAAAAAASALAFDGPI